MSTNERLNFTKISSSPSPKFGVNIIIGPAISADGNNDLWLHGVYQLSNKDSSLIPAKPLQRALVITWMSDTLSQSKNLVGDSILFHDDEIQKNDMRIGYFNYDLTDWLNMYEARDYYITVSLGNWISNTVSVSVNPIMAFD